MSKDWQPTDLDEFEENTRKLIRELGEEELKEILTKLDEKR